jgi:hypothetical protein
MLHGRICQSRKGLRKFRNFEVLRNLKQGEVGGALTDYVFIGDTGEGDLEVRIEGSKCQKGLGSQVWPL